MKNKYFVLLLLSVVSLSSCKNSDFRIKRDYAKETKINASDVYIKYDLGSYEKARVVYITFEGANYLSMSQYEKVDDNLFYYSNSLTIQVYYEQEFYSLSKAFEKDILSSKDIDEIYLKDFEYKEHLRVCYVEAEYNNPHITTQGESVSLVYLDRLHYGQYGDCVVSLYVGNNTMDKDSAETVEDYIFNYKTTDYITVWNNHEFYSLSEAYQLGYLSIENIASINEIHNQEYEKLYK